MIVKLIQLPLDYFFEKINFLVITSLLVVPSLTTANVLVLNDNRRIETYNGTSTFVDSPTPKFSNWNNSKQISMVSTTQFSGSGTGFFDVDTIAGVPTEGPYKVIDSIYEIIFQVEKEQTMSINGAFETSLGADFASAQSFATLISNTGQDLSHYQNPLPLDQQSASSLGGNNLLHLAIAQSSDSSVEGDSNVLNYGVGSLSFSENIVLIPDSYTLRVRTSIGRRFDLNGANTASWNFTATFVPLPASIVLMGSAMIFLFGLRKMTV